MSSHIVCYHVIKYVAEYKHITVYLSEIVQMMMMMMEDDESQPRQEEEGGDEGEFQITVEGPTGCSSFEASCLRCVSPPFHPTASVSLLNQMLLC